MRLDSTPGNIRTYFEVVVCAPGNEIRFIVGDLTCVYVPTEHIRVCATAFECLVLVRNASRDSAPRSYVRAAHFGSDRTQLTHTRRHGAKYLL